MPDAPPTPEVLFPYSYQFSMVYWQSIIPGTEFHLQIISIAAAPALFSLEHLAVNNKVDHRVLPLSYWHLTLLGYCCNTSLEQIHALRLVRVIHAACFIRNSNTHVSQRDGVGETANLMHGKPTHSSFSLKHKYGNRFCLNAVWKLFQHQENIS